MANNHSTQQDPVWPLPRYYFRVRWGSETFSFREVTGLDMEAEPVEYRHGDYPVFTVAGRPGKNGKVTLKDGVFERESGIRAWFEAVRADTFTRTSVVIALLNETDEPEMVWTLLNAWPAKISAPFLATDGDEPGIDLLEIDHEGITIENGPDSGS